MAKSVDAAEVEQNRLQQLKQDFFHMITHDMRTPLSSIGLSIEALSNGMAGDVSDEALPTLERAERSVGVLMNLVSDLLDLETAESHGVVLQIEKFDVRETIDEVVQLVQPVAMKSAIDLQIRLPSRRVLCRPHATVACANEFSEQRHKVFSKTREGQHYCESGGRPAQGECDRSGARGA